MFFSSCSFFRSVGLYNTPPKYSETYEEITGQKFISHQNKTENLILTLKSVKQEYSPYEEIQLVLKVFNNSTDTMFIYEPQLSGADYPFRTLIIKDSLGKQIKVTEYTLNVDYAAIADKYSRVIKPTIAPNSPRVNPMDSLIKHFSFRTGKRIIQDMNGIFTLLRENLPGTYTVKYVQGHEEYDEVKGPIKTKLESTEISYKIAGYTDEELFIRKEAEEILSAVNKKVDSLKIDSLYSLFKVNHPGNLYIPQIKEYLSTYYGVQNYKKN